MEYGLPLGLNARQAEIGALVTVATLKTSEGSGKTQTQCLFVRTEKGSCLYSAAKPGCGVNSGVTSTVAGGWLRGKTGGCRDSLAGKGASPVTQIGVNRVRVRSGRRWRKSSSAAAREKTVVSRERNREDSAKKITLEERKEVQDKGVLDTKHFSSPLQHCTGATQEKEEVRRTLTKCCHNASPKFFTQGGRRTHQEEQKEGEYPSPEIKGINKERQNEEMENRGLCELQLSNSFLAVLSPEKESNLFHSESPNGCDVACDESSCHSKNNSTEKDRDTNSELLKVHSGNNYVQSEMLTDDYRIRHNRSWDGRKATKETADNVNGFFDGVASDQESVKKIDRANIEEEEKGISQTPTDSSVEANSVSTFNLFISSRCISESSASVEGSICTARPEASWVKQGQGKSHEDHPEWYQQEVGTPEIMGIAELHVSQFESQEQNFVAHDNENVNDKAMSSPFSLRVPSISEADMWILTQSCGTTECEQRHEPVSERGVELGEICNWEHKLDVGNGDGDNNNGSVCMINVTTIQEDVEVKIVCATNDDQRLQESAHGSRKMKKKGEDTYGQTSITTIEAKGKISPNTTIIACADPSTSFALSLANPAPCLPPLGSMATGLPCQGETGVGVGVTTGVGGGQGGKRCHRRKLEDCDKVERGSSVATEEGMKEEEKDEFGVFMQAEEQAWNERVVVSASVPCGNRKSVGELPLWELYVSDMTAKFCGR